VALQKQVGRATRPIAIVAGEGAPRLEIAFAEAAALRDLNAPHLG
jgi:hypothetical protein